MHSEEARGLRLGDFRGLFLFECGFNGASRVPELRPECEFYRDGVR